jgi:hypothetical protein
MHELHYQWLCLCHTATPHGWLHFQLYEQL